MAYPPRGGPVICRAPDRGRGCATSLVIDVCGPSIYQPPVCVATTSRFRPSPDEQITVRGVAVSSTFCAETIRDLSRYHSLLTRLPPTQRVSFCATRGGIEHRRSRVRRAGGIVARLECLRAAFFCLLSGMRMYVID